MQHALNFYKAACRLIGETGSLRYHSFAYDCQQLKTKEYRCAVTQNAAPLFYAPDSFWSVSPGHPNFRQNLWNFPGFVDKGHGMCYAF